MFIHISYLKHKREVKNKINYNNFASAGSRTRVYCLEGNYPNRWTTNAINIKLVYITKYTVKPKVFITIEEHQVVSNIKFPHDN